MEIDCLIVLVIMCYKKYHVALKLVWSALQEDIENF